jgi:hypothetical protein
MVRVALAPFLLDCPQVTTLGLRAGLANYLPWERSLLAQADRVFFPTRRFIGVLDAAGKPTFPSMASYQYGVDRLLQFSLLAYLDLPFPRTRSYYGQRQKAQILRDFELPLVALSPHVAPRSECIVSTAEALSAWTARYNPVAIQELLPLARRVRLVCVNFHCLTALETCENGSPHGEFHPVDWRHPELHSLLDITLQFLRLASLDDMVVEWGYGKQQWWILGMSRPPVRIATLAGVVSRHRYVCEQIAAGLL